MRGMILRQRQRSAGIRAAPDAAADEELQSESMSHINDNMSGTTPKRRQQQQQKQQGHSTTRNNFWTVAICFLVLLCLSLIIGPYFYPRGGHQRINKAVKPGLLRFVLKTFVYPVQALVLDRVGPVDNTVIDIPEDVQSLLLSYRQPKDRIPDTPFATPILFGDIMYRNLNHIDGQQILERMHPIMENFCQCQLVNPQRDYQNKNSNNINMPRVIHGVRLYKSGSSLTEHIDWAHMWVVSASIHVWSTPTTSGEAEVNYNDNSTATSDKNIDWPITVRNGYDWWLGRPPVEIVHKPGQALLYQGARIFHARSQPFQGDEYAAVFLGYIPKYYPYQNASTWKAQLFVSGVQLLQKLRLV